MMSLPSAFDPKGHRIPSSAHGTFRTLSSSNSGARISVASDTRSRVMDKKTPRTAPEDGGTARRKRRAGPETQSPDKRARVSESEPRNREDVPVRRGKRKVREDGEGPPKNAKKRGLLDDELPSSSVDTARESRDPLEGCSTTVDLKKMVLKTEEPKEEPKEETKEEPEEEPEEVSVETRRAQFEEKYEQKNKLGAGGCGSVFSGFRRSDGLPVAIKRVPEENVICTHVDRNGKRISVEVAVMLELAARASGSAGASAPVSLLDWYDLDRELVLVMERPVDCRDLWDYIFENGGTLKEEEAKNIMKQLVEAAIHLQENHIFHRDIKTENILIQSRSDVPRVRLIDFGLSCFTEKDSLQRDFFDVADKKNA